MKVSRKVKIKNALGLHARPATMIAKILQGCRSAVTFTYRKETVNARSIMSILMLAVSRNAQILVTVEGDDAEIVMGNLIAVFENQFGEG